MTQNPALTPKANCRTDVIFDFGNVLIYWDPAEVMTPRYSDGLVEQFQVGRASCRERV